MIGVLHPTAGNFIVSVEPGHVQFGGRRWFGLTLAFWAFAVIACAAGKPFGTGVTRKDLARADPAPASGDPWSPVENCRDKNPSRPAILSIDFSSNSMEELDGWRVGEMRKALQDAGLTTKSLERSAKYWDGHQQVFLEIAGTVGSLVAGGAKLESKKGPRGLPAPGATIECAGLKSINNGFSVQLEEHADVQRLIADLGNRETVSGDGYEFESLPWKQWPLDTKEPQFTVERAIKYWNDNRVLGIEVDVACGGIPEAPPQPGCDLSVRPPEAYRQPEKKYGCAADDKSATCKRVRATATSKPRAQPAYPNSVVLSTDTCCVVFYIEDDPASECSTYQTVMGTRDGRDKVIQFYLGRRFTVRPSEVEGTWTAIVHDGERDLKRKVIVHDPSADEDGWRTIIELYAPNCSAEPYRD